MNADTFWQALEADPLDWAGYAAFSDWLQENDGSVELAYALRWMAERKHCPVLLKRPPNSYGDSRGDNFWYWVSRVKRPTGFRKTVAEARPEAGLNARFFRLKIPSFRHGAYYRETHLLGFLEFAPAVHWLSERVNLLRVMLEIPLQ